MANWFTVFSHRYRTIYDARYIGRMLSWCLHRIIIIIESQVSTFSSALIVVWGCILSVTSYRSRETWCFVTITTVQPIMCANNNIYHDPRWSYSLFLHNTASRYHHYPELFEINAPKNACRVYSVECESKITYILYIIFSVIYACIIG